MQRLSLTPFGRQPVTASLLATHALINDADQTEPVNKWALFRELCAARAMFGLKDRDLAVLNALLSFHRGDTLAQNQMLVVFPSNRTLMERAHGMAESTLRRHLAKLIDAGLLLRHDSPNGKRYARRSSGGAIKYAFGFDLRPLLARASEITRAAEQQRQWDVERKQLRADVVLCLRDIGKLIDYLGNNPDHDATFIDLSKKLRRKLTLAQLRTLITEAHAFRDQLKQLAEERDTENLSGIDSENERHTEEYIHIPFSTSDPHLLKSVTHAFPDIQDYAPQGIRTWHDLIGLACLLRAVIGIEEHLWQQALRSNSAVNIAVITCYILQRYDQIDNPRAYFRYLVEQSKYAKSTSQFLHALCRDTARSAAIVDSCQLSNNRPLCNAIKKRAPWDAF